MTEPSVSVESLLQHAGWVRGLAFSLVRDASDAEDLLHDTWMKALRHPPDARGDVRSWFRRVMVNILRQSRRSRQARADREAAVSRDRTDAAPDELVERAETLRRLVGHVLRLPEPYRRAILMRHFEDLAPPEIAARTGVPVDTVRTHVKRGYAMLRRKLEDEDGPEWPLALLPLVNWPAATPVPARPAPAIRSSLVATAGVAAIAAATAWLWTAQDAAPSRAAPPATTSRAAPREAMPRTRAGGVASAPAGSGDAATESAPPADGSQRGRDHALLVGRIATDSGAVPPSIVLHCTALVAAQLGKDLDTRDLTAKDGAVAADLPLRDHAGRRVIEWDVAIDHPDFLPYSTRARMPLPSADDPSVRMDPILLRRAGHVTGTADFDPATPGALATVGTVPYTGNYATAFDTVTAAPHARFRVRAQPGAKMLVAAVATDRVPAAREVQVAAGAEVDVGVLTLAEGVRVTGHVGTVPAMPLGSSPTVTLCTTRPRPFGFSLDGDVLIVYDAGSAWTYFAKADVRADGRFTVGGLLPGPFRLADDATSGVPGDVRNAVLVPFDAPTDHADFEYTGGVVDVLIRRGGVPLPGGGIRMQAPRKRMGGAVAGADGIARFIGVPGTTYTVETDVKDTPSVQGHVTAPALGGTASLTLDLPAPAAVAPPATWTVTIRTDAAAPPKVASFGFTAPGSPFTSLTRDVPLQDGVFRVKDVPPGRWRVEVRPGAEWYDPSGFLVADPIERDFPPGAQVTDTVDASAGGRLVIAALEADGTPAAGVSCEVFDAAHVAVPVTYATRRIAGTSLGGRTLSEAGPTDVQAALRPGTYLLECTMWPDGKPFHASAKVEIVAGKVTEAVVRFAAR